MPPVRTAKYTDLDIASHQFCGFNYSADGGIFDKCNILIDDVMNIQHELLKLESEKLLKPKDEYIKIRFNNKSAEKNNPFSNAFFFKFVTYENAMISDSSFLLSQLREYFSDADKDPDKVNKRLTTLLDDLKKKLEQILNHIKANNLMYNSEYYEQMLKYAQVYALRLFANRYHTDVTNIKDLVEKIRPAGSNGFFRSVTKLAANVANKVSGGNMANGTITDYKTVSRRPIFEAEKDKSDKVKKEKEGEPCFEKALENFLRDFNSSYIPYQSDQGEKKDMVLLI